MTVKTHTSPAETPWSGSDFPENAVSSRLSDTMQLSRDGRLFRTWFQGTIAAMEEQWFTLIPPVDKVVYGVGRIITVDAGEIRVEYHLGGTPGIKQGSDLPNFNFDDIDGPAPGSVFAQYDTVTGSEAQSPNKIFSAPTTGPTTRPSDQTESGAMVRISNDKVASFRATNDTASPVDYTIFLTYTEFPT